MLINLRISLIGLFFRLISRFLLIGISGCRQGNFCYTLIELCDLFRSCRPDTLPFTLEALRPESTGFGFPDVAAIQADQYATLISGGGCPCRLRISLIRLFFR